MGAMGCLRASVVPRFAPQRHGDTEGHKEISPITKGIHYLCRMTVDTLKEFRQNLQDNKLILLKLDNLYGIISSFAPQAKPTLTSDHAQGLLCLDCQHWSIV